MFKKHCCTWEVAFQQPLTTLPLLCMPVKPGHRPSEVSAAFIWSLSFDRVLVAVWSLLEARKHCVVCQAVADVKWCVGFFLFCFLYAWQVLTALQTFDQILCISVQHAFFWCFLFQAFIHYCGVMVRKALSENMPFLTMFLTVLLTTTFTVSACTAQVRERWEGST